MLFASIVPKAEYIQLALDELKRFIQLTLPSVAEEVNIDKVEVGNKEGLTAIRDRLLSAKKNNKVSTDEQ